MDGSGSLGKEALLGVTIGGTDLIRIDPLCSCPLTPVGQEALDASRERKASRQRGEGRGARERGTQCGSVPTGPEMWWQHLGASTVPSRRQMCIIIATTTEGLAPKDKDNQIMFI